MRPKLAAVEPILIVHHVGKLSARDMMEVYYRLWQALGLDDTELDVLIQKIDLQVQTPSSLQSLTEIGLEVIMKLDDVARASIDLTYLRALLAPLKP